MKVLFIFLINIFLLTSNSWCQPEQVKEDAKLITFKGVVKLNQKLLTAKDKDKNIPLSQGSIIEALGKQSFFIIKYKDGSRFMLTDGHLKIINLESKNTLISLIRGTIHSYVNPKSHQKFKVKTKRVSFAVRGTKFYIQESPYESYLCVCEGTVAVKNNHSLLLVNRGEDTHIKNSQGPLEKRYSSLAMWAMAADGFKKLGITISPQPK